MCPLRLTGILPAWFVLLGQFANSFCSRYILRLLGRAQKAMSNPHENGNQGAHAKKSNDGSNHLSLPR